MDSSRRIDLRNIAIIAHVDHGKTTLVDAMLRQTGMFQVKKDESQECVMDSNELERERGITILAKNTAVPYKDFTINIVDTPGHADFGSEVERILKMVDGVLLLVDALDGPMPQTKFVLRKSLELGLRPIVVINKVDRPHANPHAVLDKTFSLFLDLGATDQQLDFPVIYASGRQGWATTDLDKPSQDLIPLFEAIVAKVPGPAADHEASLQMLVTMLDYSSFTGRIAIGKISSGRLAKGLPVTLLKRTGSQQSCKVTQLLGFTGLTRQEISEAQAGDIVAVCGAEDVTVGDTIAAAENPQALPPLVIDEPTLSMEFMVNDSPFSGQDGKFLTSRHLRERLWREKETNVGLQVEEVGSQGVFKVSGRGELHLSILIETMRREGYELAVSRPQVITKTQNGIIQEPADYLVIDIQKDHQGAAMDLLGSRGAVLQNMHMESDNSVRLEYVITVRGMMGFKNDFLTATRGTGVMHQSFHGYIPKQGDLTHRKNGVLIAKEEGLTTGYALEDLQERAVLFLGPAVPVYKGMIVGQNSRDTDMIVNPCRKKALTNMRASGSDDAIVLTPPTVMTLEKAIEFIEQDELVEVTPQNVRLRKKDLNAKVSKRSSES